ncbi:MAG: hypothetical protein ACKVOR_06130 [Flavobacteriales bacterium]
MKIFRKETEAIDYVIKGAVAGSFVVICIDMVLDALEQIMKLKEGVRM